MSVKYLFIDMNSYFASVEQQLRPELRGRPVAVVPVLAETTSCIAASYEAKAFGIRTGTRVSEARRMCPQLRIVEARPREYVKVHERFVSTVETCLPVTAVLSIDELVCKLAGRDQEPDEAVQLARRIKSVFHRELGAYLRCSIGLGPNRMLAKVASDMQKPDGLTLIRKEELPSRLFVLQLTDLPGIGARMEQRLRRYGIVTVEQLCGLSLKDLSHVWGSRVHGTAWWGHLHGEDVPPPPTRRRTLGHSHVLAPQWRKEDTAWTVMMRLVEKAAARLRYIGYWTGSVAVNIDFQRGGRWHKHRRLSLCQDTPTLVEVARELWEQKPAGIPLRIGVVFTNLAENRNVALPLFPEDRKRLDLSRAMDEVNQKCGAQSVHFAETHDAQDQAPTRIAFTQIPDLRLADS